MRYLTVLVLCCLAPALSGCIVGKAVGAAIDVTASAANAAVKVTGAAVKTTVDVVTPDGDDDEDDEKDGEGEAAETARADAGEDYETPAHTARIDRPRP